MWRHFNVISAATTQFSGTPDRLPLVSTASDYGEHHQVQTGSRNYPKPEVLITWLRKQISTRSQLLHLCFGGSFSLMCMSIKPDASFTQKFQDGGHIPEVVITLRRKMISRWSKRLRQCFRARPIPLHQHRHCPTKDITIMYKPEVETVPKTGSTNKLAT